MSRRAVRNTVASLWMLLLPMLSRSINRPGDHRDHYYPDEPAGLGAAGARAATGQFESL